MSDETESDNVTVVGSTNFESGMKMLDGKGSNFVRPVPDQRLVWIGLSDGIVFVGPTYSVEQARAFGHKILEACNYVQYGGKWSG